MQILGNVVQLVPVNVVDDLSRLRSSNLAMLPLLTVVPFCAGRPNSLSVKRLTVSAVCFFCACSSRLGWSQFRIRGDFVTSPHVLSWRKTVNFFRVGVERITMSVPHLVVPHAQVARCDRAVAVEALSAHNLAAPAVLWASVSLHAFVVHQAQPVRCVLSTTTFDGANLHGNPYLWIANCMYYKALGNSWAVPNVAWIGQRIDAAVRRLQ